MITGLKSSSGKWTTDFQEVARINIPSLTDVEPTALMATIIILEEVGKQFFLG